MNIQIFGKSKCFDSKKAERWFKERRIRYQYIDLRRIGISRREFQSVKDAVGFGALLDGTAPGAELVRYLAHQADQEEKLLEEPELLRTPIVRNGREATVGYAPEVWAVWESREKQK